MIKFPKKISWLASIALVTGSLTANAEESLIWLTLQLDNLESSPVTVESITEVNQVLYKIQPTSDGTLYVTQTDSGDSHIFTNESCTDEYLLISPAFNPGLSDGQNYYCTYYLDGGETYYFKAKLPYINWETGEWDGSTTYDDISEVSFTKWEVDTSVPETLPLNQVVEVAPNEEFTNVGQGTTYLYQPQEDGTLEIYTTSYFGGDYLFSNKGHSKQVNPYTTVYELETSEGFISCNKYSVEAGKSYYIYPEISYSSYKWMAVYSPVIFKLEVSASPEPGAYDYGLYTDITLNGTGQITVESITLKYGSESQTLKEWSGEGSYDYQITGERDNILQVKMDGGLLTTMKDAQATSFSLEFNGLTCGGEAMGENGVYTLNYTIPDPFNLSNADWPTNFYTYWAPGNQEGMFTITFDSEVGKVGEVNAIPGTFTPGSTSGSQVSFPLKAEINPENKNQIVIDMTGVNYETELEKWNQENENDDPEWSSETFQSTMSIVLMDIQSAQGLTFTSGGYAILYHNGITMNQNAYPGDVPPTYMSTEPTVDPQENTSDKPYTTLDKVTISWGETVTLVDGQTLTVNVALGNAADVSVAATLENGNVVADISSVYPENADYSGLVTVSIPGIMVKNAAGEVNNYASFEYYVEIEVADPINPEGTFAPETGYIYTEGEIVNVTLTFDQGSQVTQGSTLDPVTLNNGTSNNIYTWSNTNVLSIDSANSMLLINLGALAVGEYTLAVNVGAVLVDGIENAAASTQFTVAADKSGVGGLKDENGNLEIYTLQGVKVDANKIGKGIYIVNGKKVIVK